MFKCFFASAAFLIALTVSAAADPTVVGDLTINHATIRATAPGAKVGAGYVSITNGGTVGERLTGGHSEFAHKVEIHEMKMVDQVMKMRPLKQGIEIPPGSTVKLIPGGNHLMFMKLDGQLKAGEQRNTTLIFEKAGKVDLTFNVKSIADTMKMKSDH